MASLSANVLMILVLVAASSCEVPDPQAEACVDDVTSLLQSRTAVRAKPVAGEDSQRQQATPNDGIVSVSLKKQDVPVMVGNRTVAHKSAYFGTVFAGLPGQSFTVVFDTGSGHFVLPSAKCTSEACQIHQRYSVMASKIGQDIEHDGTLVKPGAAERDQVTIAYGTGSIRGEFVQETICLRDPGATASDATSLANRADCVPLRLVLATEMSDDPFKMFSFDGVLGLGLESLALKPEFNFLGQMARTKPSMKSMFSVYLAPGDDGESEISFGGYKEHRLVPGAGMSWAPVASPELGFWQLRIKAFRIGGESVSFCDDGNCKAVVDTGTSLLGVPKEAHKSLHWKLARQIEYTHELDCRTFPGPLIEFDMGDFTVQLGAQDYSRPGAARMRLEGSNDTAVFCRASLLPVDMEEPLGKKVFLFGEPVLRRYYTAFDVSSKRIGFGPLVVPHASDEVAITA